MSILDEIDFRCKSGYLLLLEPRTDPRMFKVPTTQRRTLYVSPAIHEFVLGDRPLAAETQGDFYDFIFGETVTAALELDHEYCFIARLQAAHEEVWELRIWEPTILGPRKPQLRFFGRFAGRNIFVALIGPFGRWTIRPNQYERFKRITTREWNRLFSESPFEKGDEIDAYLSNVDLV